MTVPQEGNLQVTIDGEANAWKFDSDSHGLSHCMKAVDFIIELQDRYLFLEFKDPQHPMASQKSRDEFTSEFQSGKLDEDLKYKYRDSFLYQWAVGKIDKAVYYLVLVADEALTDADLIVRTDELTRIMPMHGPATGSWIRRIVEGCAVFNIESWNRSLPNFPVTRLDP